MRLGQKGAILLALACLLTVLVLPGVSASTSPRSFSFGAAGDFGNTSAARSTFSAAGSAGLDFFLVLGDSTYGQTSETAWCNAFKAKVPQVLIQAGNHETGESSGANLTKLVSACPYGLNETLTGQYGREWFFDYPKGAPLARLILTGCGTSFVIDHQTKWNCTAGDPHYSFVSDAIDGARSAGIPWVIVGMQKVCISDGSRSCEIGTDFFDLLLEKRVDLILQAQQHVYQASKQLTCATPKAYNATCVADDGTNGTYTKGEGSILMIQGTGGRSHDTYDPSDPEADYFVTGFDSTYGFVKYTVSTTDLHVQFIRSSGGSDRDAFLIASTPSSPGSPSGSNGGGSSQFSTAGPDLVGFAIVAAVASGATAGVIYAVQRKRPSA